MMKHVLLGLLTLCACYTLGNAQTTPTKMDYNAAWKKINTLLNEKGQPKTALDEVQKVYAAALADKEYGQLLKAITFRNTCITTTEEDAEELILAALKEDADRVPQPTKAVIYTMVGDVYKEYYNRHRWEMYGRTTVSAKPEDFRTWSAEQLTAEATRYYKLSLQNDTQLQQTPVDLYKVALVGDTAGRAVLPTLFDMLAFHALSAYAQMDAWSARPRQAFVINKPEYFKAANSFVLLEIEAADTLSFKYQSLLLYQQLLSFRLNQARGTAPLALVDLDLRRLRYIKSSGNYPDVDVLYEKALQSYLFNPGLMGAARSYITYELAYLYKTQGDGWRTSHIPQHRARLVQAYALCREILAAPADNKMVQYAEAMQRVITIQSISLQVNQEQATGTPILCLATYRNVNNIYLNEKNIYLYAYNVDEKTARRFERNSGYDSYRYRDYLVGKKPVMEKQVKTVSQPDYQSYTAEVMMDGLPQGHYIILASNVANPLGAVVKKDVNLPEGAFVAVAQSTVQVSDLLFMAHGNEQGKLLAYVTDRKTGKPVSGAKLEMYSRSYNGDEEVGKLEETRLTDENGTAIISDGRVGSRTIDRVVVSADSRKLVSTLNSNGYYNRGVEQHTRVTFFADRAIYRPGQTVYFKGLAYETNGDGDNKLRPNVAVPVYFKDVNGQLVSSLNLTTNEYGSVQGSFVIPQGVLNGQMNISTSYYDALYFNVEEYKRPTFDVRFDPVQGNVALNDTVRLTGMAKALAGYAVDNAKVQYRVQRTVRYRTYRWWWPPVADTPEREVASGVVSTDGKGAFAIDFAAVADDVTNSDLIYSYTVTADVTDLNGETRSAMLAVQASKKPLLVKLELPERITAADSLRFAINTTNLNGDFTAADVSVTVNELQSPNRILRKRIWSKPDTLILSRAEFEKAFPFDPYDNDDDPSTYKLMAQQALVTLNTSSTKVLDLSALKNAKSGWYSITVKARTEKGVEVEQQLYVQLDGAKPSPIRNMEDWVKVVKAKGEPGESAAFLIAGGEAKSHIRYEVLFKNKLVEQHVVEVGTSPQLVQFPIKEEYRGGFAVQFAMVQHNRVYTSLQEVQVPYTNKRLDVAFTTFRDKLLPGEKEAWTVTVKNKAGEKEMAEMVATLYDASLNAFAPLSWQGFDSFYPRRGHYAFTWSRSYRSIIYASGSTGNNYTPEYRQSYEQLLGIYNYDGASYGYGGGRFNNFMIDKDNSGLGDGVLNEDVVTTGYAVASKSDTKIMMRGTAAPAPAPMAKEGGAGEAIAQAQQQPEAQLTEIATRQNFNETAFFYPQLRTNEEGEILIDFTIPEALTRWAMLGFAHTKDFKIGSVSNELITQKQVAISANTPRFFREGDTIMLTAKVNNLTEGSLSGKAMLRLYDATNMQPIEAQLLRTEQTPTFTVEAGGSAGVQWTLVIPQGLQAVSYKLTAQAGQHTDGEEKLVPVLTNSMLVTETMPFSVRAGQQKEFTFEHMRDNKSTTLRNHRLTLEFTSNPAWYAIQALPYLMEYPHECAEQTFSRFYANSLASAVVNSSPKVKQVFTQWSTLPDSKALLSNLEKNEELKQAVLAETPWVMDAKSESEAKKRIALLFDLNRMANEQGRAFRKLQKMQYNNGGIPWFDGMEPSRYVTQHIVAGMAHLAKLNALGKGYNTDDMVADGLNFLDGFIKSDYDDLVKYKVKLDDMYIDNMQIHYLYACSFSAHKPDDEKQLKAFTYYMGQAERYWARTSVYQQAMLSLIFNRYGNKELAQQVLRSLKERSQHSEEMGMYWKDNLGGYYWYQAPIETQAVLIEAFNEVAKDTKSVEEMKIWLLRNKQTNDWQTTKATSEATYALLMTGSNLLANDQPLAIQIDGKPLAEVATEPIRPEAGTGYVKTAWGGSDIKPGMATLQVQNKNTNGVAWGGMYWQYFEQLDKIKQAETNLKMTKQLFLKKITDKGASLEPITEANTIQVGDLVMVRMELRADRDYEYVHLKDMRAAGFEPVSTISGYRYKNNLGYYESVKDASINFFIAYLPKGTYVFEYELRVAHAGEFSNGITTFQCMYAPEFSAHSQGIRVKVKEQ